MIEDVYSLDPSWLMDKHCAGITSGASTPTYLTNQVIDYLKQFDPKDKKTWVKPHQDLTHIL